jgi:SNF2 family N-terminal domain.
MFQKKIKIANKPKKKVTSTISLELAKKEKDDDLEELPAPLIVIDDVPISERLAKPESNVIVQSSQYYMNNRENFINFINRLFDYYKDELNVDDDSVSCESVYGSNDFSLLTHQKIVRDYMNIYTPYRGILLYHGLGSGKTCSSIAIAEGLKTKNQIMVMTPASLRVNYLEELKKCGDLLYKKNQYWEFISTKDNPKYLDTLSDILSIEKNFIQRNNGAWLVNIKKKPNFDTLTNEQRNNLDSQINEMIRKKYQFISYNGLRRSHLTEFTKDFTINPFDNKVIIIDEVHNL